MPQLNPTSVADAMQQIAAATQAGDIVRAQQLLDQLGPQTDPRLPQAIANLLMRQQQWALAVATFDRIDKPSLGCQLQRQLAANLVVLQDKRPEIYQIAIEAQPQTQCQVVPQESGPFIITQQIPGQQPVSLSQRPDPKSHAQQSLDAVNQTIHTGRAILAAGVGDGYLLTALSDALARIDSPCLPTIYVIEPDPEVLINGMMIHDYTQRFGPIACENFRWFVGPDWQQQFRQAMLTDAFLTEPSSTILLSLHGQAIMDPINQILSERKASSDALARDVEAYYSTLHSEHLVELLGPTPPRPPRVLVMTCRFTTVLQYSARDVQHAFENLGWDTKLIIEPAAYHRLTYLALRSTLLAFKPDIVFGIDHLRCESRSVYPENLPHICWIQDNLPNLTNRQAGQSIGKRDFVLTSNRPTYCGLYGYPQRQCIDMGKLTRRPTRPDQWSSNADHLVYVSNASRTGEELADALIEQIPSDQNGQQLIRACCNKILDIYRTDGCIESAYQILQLIQTVEAQEQLKLADAATRRLVVSRLVHPFNDALYRQQGLRWAAAVANRLGLKLAIYGNGWESHPTLGAYAQGPVAYGTDLEALTRDSQINLRLEPYPSLAHQRMIDGLVAGGFFLHRYNEAESHGQALANFLHEHVDQSVQTLEQAHEAIGAEHRQTLDLLIASCPPTMATGLDLIQGVRMCQRTGLLALHGQPLPQLDEITFTNEHSLDKCVQRFIHDPATRDRICLEQRQYVEQRLTYTAGMQRMISQMRDRLATESVAKPKNDSPASQLRRTA